ncbi:type II secretion system protein [Pseudalkalibacillus hwajinpoensis]|uniref:type II secretion system protein n=1 Tax=Guptibacillus hwajinpoensis TaxID=208199 RepID=UPI00325A4DC9
MKDESGITLLELILTITIFMAIATVLPLLMNAAVKSTGDDLQNEEAQLFFHLIRKRSGKLRRYRL